MTRTYSGQELISGRACINPELGKLFFRALGKGLTDTEAVLFENHILACLVCREEYLATEEIAKEVEEHFNAFFSAIGGYKPPSNRRSLRPVTNH